MAQRVKRGVRFLDRKVPMWRRVMRKHDSEFDLSDGDHCVLGTLEHRVGKLRVAARKLHTPLECDNGFGRLARLFGIYDNTTELGFDYKTYVMWALDEDEQAEQQYRDLQALWRAEYLSARKNNS
jgi:hypothetical protein